MLKSLLKIILPAATLTSAYASIYDIPVKTLDKNKETTLAQHKGKVILIVNVASKCGLTKQYETLEALQKKYAKQGFTVAGFPCNQFGGQEPGNSEKILEFCSTTYGVTFPMYAKGDVNGKEQQPLYTFLSGKNAAFPGKIKWNFTKFLVDQNGKVIARFGSRTQPDAPEVISAIETALKVDTKKN